MSVTKVAPVHLVDSNMKDSARIYSNPSNSLSLNERETLKSTGNCILEVHNMLVIHAKVEEDG